MSSKAEVLQRIAEAEVRWSCADLKACIFQDDLHDCEITETITTGVFHNYSLVKDALNRTGNGVNALAADAEHLIAQWPGSYANDEDEEFAVWDVADAYVMEVLGRDSRICKRAGW